MCIQKVYQNISMYGICFEMLGDQNDYFACFEMVVDYNDYFEIEFAALMSFKRFHIIQTLEVKHNLVIA